MSMTDRIRALILRDEIHEVFTIKELLDLHPLGNGRHQLDGVIYKSSSISTGLANRSIGPAAQRIGIPAKRGLQPIEYMKHLTSATYSIASDEQISEFFRHYLCEDECSIADIYPHACRRMPPTPAQAAGVVTSAVADTGCKTESAQLEENSAALLAARIFNDADGTHLDIHNTYLQSYPHLCSFFANKETLVEGELVQAAHMVYGWMPTILNIRSDTAGETHQKICSLLDRSCSHILVANELETLASAINNSMVGASKLLHFRSPDKYPIWDSRVCTYFKGEPFKQHQMRSVERYQEYMRCLDQVSKDQRSEDLRSKMSRELGYEISTLRALELVMFQNSDQYD